MKLLIPRRSRITGESAVDVKAVKYTRDSSFSESDANREKYAREITIAVAFTLARLIRDKVSPILRLTIFKKTGSKIRLVRLFD